MTHANAAYGNQPWMPVAPQPWDPNGYVPFEARPRWEPELEFDPGIYVTPQGPAWDGDPGIHVDPDESAIDPGIYVAPPASEPAEPVDPTADMGVGAHALHAANTMVLPGVLAGAVSGMFAASTHSGNKLLAFGSRALDVTGSVILTGAATGALVGLTSPDREASLEARYAIAGGVAGAATGALMPSGATRGVGAATGAVTSAVLGWLIGRGLERREDAAAASTAPTQPPRMA